MNRAIRYRLYPTTEQMTMFAKTFGCCRKVWNLMLEAKLSSYKETGKFASVTPAMFKKEFPYLKEVDSLALANVQLNLQAAFRNRFSKTRKKRNAFPKFKTAKRCRKAYTTNNQHGGTVAVYKNCVRLPKIGNVKAVIHRMPEADWRVKSATVSREADGSYYASVLFSFERTVSAVPVSDNAVGLDYASNGLYVDDRGNIGSGHKYYRESSKRLAKAQRSLSRMKGSRKGETKSKNYLKQEHKVNRIHRHIANQRLDNLHKISTEIANRYDVVCVESLNMTDIAHMLPYRNYHKATYDNGYGMFLKMLEYKLADRGKYFVKVDKSFLSSQICHACGRIHPEMKDLRIRTMKCDCGLTMGRDQNAAINIKKEGLRILQSETFAV